MPQDTTIYDLTLLLSTSVEQDQRANVLSEVESAISAGGGSVERKDDWGVRPMTYRIRHQAEAEYQLLQFSGPPALLESLSHSLRIADEVLRFRIIRVLPGTPSAPDSAPPVVAAVAGGGGTAGAGSQSAAAASAPPASPPAPAPAAAATSGAATAESAPSGSDTSESDTSESAPSGSDTSESATSESATESTESEPEE